MSERIDRRFFRIVIFLLTLAVMIAARPLDRAFANTCGAGTISLTGTSVSVNFNGLASSPDGGLSSVLPAGYCLDERGGGGADDEQYVVSTGSVTGGNVYSFGATGAADRSFGSLASGSVETTVGVIITNNTGSAITSLNIAYVMEQWRLGETSSGDLLTFAYSVGATAIETGTWTDVSTLDGEAVKYSSAGAPTALDGNDAANRRSVSGIFNVNVAAGSTIGLRWRDVNTSGGGDQGLSVDDLVVTVNSSGGNNPPTITPTNPSETGVLTAVSPAYVSVEVGDTTYSGAPLSFTVGDSETPVASLNVSAVSSNTAVIPAANLVVGGAGATRTIGFTAVAQGISNITITVTDSASAVATYVIRVGATADQSSFWLVRSASASTSVSAGGGYFFVGDDENQQLRLWNITSTLRADQPQYFLDVTSNLNLPDAGREVDFEGSSRVGNTIYWIASHSNSSTGEVRQNRYRLFSTTISGSGATATLAFGGYTTQLRSALLTWDSTNAHGLGANYFGLTASANGIAPESPNLDGFNIEGFTVAPNGTTFYIGFRAPIVPATNRTKALIVPVTNVPALTTGTPSAVAPAFGAPIQLDLGGRGIRSIECAVGGQCLIVAGASSTANTPRLFTWTGNAADAPVERATNLAGFNPEGIVYGAQPFTDNTPIGLLSDDGDFDWYNFGTRNQELVTQVGWRRTRVVDVTLGAPVGVPTVRPDTPALYNQQNAFFQLRNFNSGGPTTYAFPFGPANDPNIVPLIGDWNGDNIDTVGIYNRANGSFILSNDNATVAASFPYGPGGSGLVPIVGDWDGDGDDTAGLYNPANGAWLLINVNASAAPESPFLYGPGGANLIPIPGDWDGNGSDTPGLFNTANSAWILSNAQNAAPFAAFPYGDGTLSPIRGDWNANGTDTPGHYNPVNGAWLLINQTASVAPELTFIYGVSPQGNLLIARAGKWPPGGSGGSVAPDTTSDEPQIAPTFAP